MQVTVSYNAINQPIEKMGQCAQRLTTLLSEVQTIRKAIGANSQAFNAPLQRVITATRTHCANIDRLRSAAETAALEYIMCESKLTGNDVSAYVPQAENAQGGANVDWGPLLEVMGSFGVVGSVAGALLGVVDNPKAIGTGVTKLVETGAKMAVKIADGELIDIWGSSTVDAIGFRENLANNLDEYVINSSYNSKNMSVAAKNASNISAVAKWAGVAVTGMLNFADNTEEFGADFSNPRLYAETASETAIDVGVGILVGAGVAALAGATAPVWAVGVVTAGAVVLIDKVSEAITGKDLAEAVSDVVLDTVEATGKAVKKVGEFVGNAVSATADRISAGWKKFKSWF